MIKVTARASARAISSFTHFAFSIVQNMMVMDLLLLSQSGGDNNTNPNRRQDTEYTTRRAGPQCVLKNKRTR